MSVHILRQFVTSPNSLNTNQSRPRHILYSQSEDESESHVIPCLKCEKLVVDKVKVSLGELGDSKPKHYKLRSVQDH